MSNLYQSFWVEFLKARRSRLPILTGLGFSLAPLAGGFFMIVLKDPALARRLGLISAKAQIVAGTADWPTYLGLLAQANAIGGIFVFSIICSWVFGREYSDRTAKDLLALPTPRSIIVLAKLILVILWSAGLTVVIFLLGLGVGIVVSLPPASPDIFWQGTLTLAISSGLTIALTPPIAFVASAGRGYLPPMGAAILTVILAQIIAAAGWGEYFPWSVPALYAGMAGPEYAQLGALSYAIVGFAGLVGVFGTLAWWAWADQV